MLLLPSFAGAQPGALNPQLLECGRHGEAEIVCGTVAPEDFERTPDSRFLIVAKMGRDEVKGLDLFDPATQTFTAIPLSADKRSDWGEGSSLTGCRSRNVQAESGNCMSSITACANRWRCMS
jgi:hypothetical protein